MTDRQKFVGRLEKRLWRQSFMGAFLGISGAVFFLALAFWFGRNDDYYSVVQHWLFIFLMVFCAMGSLALCYESWRFIRPKKNPIIADLEAGAEVYNIHICKHRIYFFTLNYVEYQIPGKVRRILAQQKETQREIINGLRLFERKS